MATTIVDRRGRDLARLRPDEKAGAAAAAGARRRGGGGKGTEVGERRKRAERCVCFVIARFSSQVERASVSVGFFLLDGIVNFTPVCCCYLSST